MTAVARQLRGRSDLALNATGGVTARLIFPTASADLATRIDSPSGNQAAA
jgi:hypothetical protein